LKDIGRGKLLIRPPELSINPTSSHLVTKQEEVAKEIMNLALRSIFVHTSKVFFTFRKILRHGANGFTSHPKGAVLRIFIAIKNPSPSARIEPANLGLNGKHADNYTTEEDSISFYFYANIWCKECMVNCYTVSV
jgi:hypothetical protein